MKVKRYEVKGEICLRYAQTTWNDLGEWSLAGGFTPRPGLVALRRARRKSSSSRQIPFAVRMLIDLFACP